MIRGRHPRRGAGAFESLAAAVLLAAAASAHAQGGAPAAGSPPEVMHQRDIESALKPAAPQGRTRGLRIAPRTEPAAAPAQGAAASPAGDAAHEAESAAAPSRVALDIPFEINSSALRPAAAAQLEQLAAALRSDSLAPYRFMIAGHTDASGDANYNRRLSGRRADTVRRRLIDAGVPAARLEARGFGEDELLDPEHPTAAANRRVEIRNLGTAAP
ncbi:MAG: OmpA family protein [Steroidobacteraceae bacterium]